MNQQAPDHTTHVPIKVVIPTEDDVMLERPRAATPSLWQVGVQVTNKADPERTGTVRAVDYVTRQFRLVGQPRTHWESFEGWNVLVEKSPEEKAKEAAREELDRELLTLDPADLAAVEAFVDDADPDKALKRFNAMKQLGIIGKKKAGK